MLLFSFLEPVNIKMGSEGRGCYFSKGRGRQDSRTQRKASAGASGFERVARLASRGGTKRRAAAGEEEKAGERSCTGGCCGRKLGSSEPRAGSWASRCFWACKRRQL